MWSLVRFVCLFNYFFCYEGINTKQTRPMFDEGNTRSANEVSEPKTAPVLEPSKRQKAEEVPEQATKGMSTPVKKPLIKKGREPVEVPTTPAIKLNVKDQKPSVSHSMQMTDSSTAGSSTRLFCQTSTWASLQQSRMVINSV